MRTPEATASRTISCNALTPLAVSALRSASWAELSPELSVDLTRDSSDKACSPSRESLGLPLSLANPSFRPTPGEAAGDAELKIERETVAVYMYECIYVCIHIFIYI